MMCSCNNEVSSHARFCPYCGTSLATDSSATTQLGLPITKILAPNDLDQQEPGLWSGVTTGKEADWVPPLPPKYKDMLNLGTSPELVIWELFKRNLELRELLEEIVTSLPTGLNNIKIERAVLFLRSHCGACGDKTDQGEDGHTPLCAKCLSRLA